jgi:hypothetical protein
MMKLKFLSNFESRQTLRHLAPDSAYNLFELERSLYCAPCRTKQSFSSVNKMLPEARKCIDEFCKIFQEEFKQKLQIFTQRFTIPSFREPALLMLTLLTKILILNTKRFRPYFQPGLIICSLTRSPLHWLLHSF